MKFDQCISIRRTALVVGFAALSVACDKEMAPDHPEPKAKAEEPAPTPKAKAPSAHADTHAKTAQVGHPAPDFTLTSVDGKEFKLSAHKGKTVVLEWFNPGCPFVKGSHSKGSLKGLADKHKAEVTWVAINSGGVGKGGHGAEASREGAAKLGINYPVLLDESGSVGHLYGAQRTPHMFVIDPEGKLVYRGAIDNSPDGTGESPEGGKLVNYVEGALEAIKAHKPVEPAETQAYGCTVKYGAS